VTSAFGGQWTMPAHVRRTRTLFQASSPSPQNIRPTFFQNFMLAIVGIACCGLMGRCVSFTSESLARSAMMQQASLNGRSENVIVEAVVYLNWHSAM